MPWKCVGETWRRGPGAELGEACGCECQRLVRGAGLAPSDAQAVRGAQSAGVRVVGYVATGYGKDPIASVRAQIADYYTWYRVDGIFLDETPYACNASLVEYYRSLRNAIVAHARQSHAHGIVVMNPGTVPAGDCYMSIADVLVTFEDTEHVYTATTGNHYSPAAWLSRYPASRFWHIVYGVPDAAAMLRVLSLAAARGAGWVYVTDLGLPNPYGALPAYWSQETAAAAKTPLPPPHAHSPAA